MSRTIMITGETLTGKTLVALGLAKFLKSKGMKVGYLKPVGEFNDKDASVMKAVLSLDDDIDIIMPLQRTKTSFDEFLKKGRDSLLSQVIRSHETIAEKCDYVIVEGMQAPWHLLHVGLSAPQICHELEAAAICLVNFRDETKIDEILMMRDFFKQYGNEDFSVVLNQVPPMLRKTIDEQIQPYLEEQGIQFLGTLFESKELYSPSIREIQKALDGQMVTGEHHLDYIIEHFIIGSMAPENALKWFRRTKDKAVITSGDRSDICLAAMETETKLLILTGGIGPDIRTLARARELDLPIMMTAYDTYTTGNIVDSLVGSIDTENLDKVSSIERIILESVDFSKLE